MRTPKVQQSKSESKSKSNEIIKEKEQDEISPKLIFELENEDIPLPSSDAPWEGTLPPGMPQAEGARQAGFVPLEAKAGDLVLIHGQVDHLSLDNTSDASRHTFQLHLVEGGDVTWHQRNWLQYPVGKNFPSLNMNLHN